MKKMIRYHLSAVLAASICLLSAKGADLVSHYTFDGNLSDSVGTFGLLDVVGAGVSFSDERPAALSSGRALVIDGAAQPYLRTGQTMQFTGADFTVAFWVKPAASAQGTHMSALAIHESDFAKGELLLMGESPHDLRMYHEEGANIAVRNEARAAIHRGQWQHIAWTYDANREHSTLFVNGMRVNDRRSGGIQQGSSIRGQLILGRRADSRLRGDGRHFFNGSLADLRVYSGVLSDAGIQALARGQGAAPSPVTAPATAPAPAETQPTEAIAGASGEVVYKPEGCVLFDLRNAPVAGRFVRISLPGRQQYLALAEVQVFSGGRNIALGKPARQSSSHATFTGAEKAVDGNVSGRFGDRSLSHTGEDREPWWEVDLSTVAAIDGIVVWNRTDSAVDRLEGFRVEILDAARQTVWLRDDNKAPRVSASKADDGGVGGGWMMAWSRAPLLYTRDWQVENPQAVPIDEPHWRENRGVAALAQNPVFQFEAGTDHSRLVSNAAEWQSLLLWTDSGMSDEGVLRGVEWSQEGEAGAGIWIAVRSGGQWFASPNQSPVFQQRTQRAVSLQEGTWHRLFFEQEETLGLGGPVDLHGPLSVDALGFFIPQVTERLAIGPVVFHYQPGEQVAAIEAPMIQGDMPERLPRPKPATDGTSALVFEDEQGRLQYTPHGYGDVIPDFSWAGYRNNSVPIPDVPVRVTLDPSPDDEDDSVRIQEAINRVSAMPMQADGFRGTVLLRRGHYNLDNDIRIETSGVVLRGEGQFEDGTVLKLRPARRMAAIRVGGFAERQARGNSGTWPVGIEQAGSRRKIVSAYVGVGARSLELEDTSPFSAGDRIQILRPATNSWFDKLGMHNFPDRRIAWVRPDAYFEYDRHVVAVEGNTLTFDAPLPQSIDSRFGSGYVYRFAYPIEVVDCGVENLRLVSNPDMSVMVAHAGSYIAAADRHNQRQSYPGDIEHGRHGVIIDCASDIWVRNITAVNFAFAAVNAFRDSRRITIQDSACLDPVSPKRGGYRYSFSVFGQQTLVQRCYTRRGRHDYVINAWTRGPNVFVDSVSDIAWNLQEPHHRWGHGTLYDNIFTEGPWTHFAAVNRGNLGVGHGWAGAVTVFWNCAGPYVAVQETPTAQNYAIGFLPIVPRDRFFEFHTAAWISRNTPGHVFKADWPFLGDGWRESPGGPVTPRSLFYRQIQERLGDEALQWMTTPLQREGTTEAIWNHIRKELSQ